MEQPAALRYSVFWPSLQPNLSSCCSNGLTHRSG
jgi:hypothetical protein